MRKKCTNPEHKNCGFRGMSDPTVCAIDCGPLCDTKRGGRGKCDLCGGTYNNVAYHRAHECDHRNKG